MIDCPRSIFTRHCDGTVTVDDWYREQWFSKDAIVSSSNIRLANSRQLGIWGVGKLRAEIIVANGRAVYEIVNWDPLRNMCKGHLIEAEIDTEVKHGSHANANE